MTRFFRGASRCLITVLLAISGLSLMTNAASAAGVGSLAVSTTNSAGEPLANISVMVDGTQRGVTDLTGSVNITAIAEGPHSVALVPPNDSAYVRYDTGYWQFADSTWPVAAQLQRGATARVTVLAEDGTPVPNQTLRLQSSDSREATTDAAGIATFTGLVNSYRIDATTPMLNRSPLYIYVYGEQTFDFGMTVYPRAELNGTVVGPGGAPVSGAQVMLQLSAAYGGTAIAPVTTGADGSFALVDLVSAEYLLSVAPPMNSTLVPPAPQAIILTGGANTTTISLAEGSRTEGTVRDAAGAPIGGAQIQIAGPVYRSITTSADGRYSVQGLPTGFYYLGFTATGYVPAQASTYMFTLGTTQQIDVTLTRTGSLTGHVRNPDGTAAAGVSVYASGTTTGSVGVSFTDQFGVYGIGGLSPDLYQLTFAPIGGASGTAAVQVASGSNGFDFTLPAGATVTGRVTDSIGNPISGATVLIEIRSTVTAADGTYRITDLTAGSQYAYVQATGFDGASLLVESLVAGETRIVDIRLSRPALVRGTITNRTGQPLPYSGYVSISGPALFTAAYVSYDGTYSAVVPAGTYTVTIQLWQYGTFTYDGIIVTDGQTTVVDHRVIPPPTIAGRITNDAGSPLAGVVVSAQGLGEVATDVNGNYSFANASAGPIELTVSRFEDYTTPLPRTIDVGTDDIANDYVLRRTGIQGVVHLADGTPVQSIQVLATFFTPTSAYMISVSTDAQGHYVLYGFPAGTTSVHFVTFPIHAAVGKTVSVDVVEGQLKTLDVTLGATGRLKGVVRAPNGHPVPGARLSYDGLGPAVFADANGRFDLFRFSATGRYNITVRPPAGLGLSTTKFTVDITVGQTKVQDLTLQKAGRLAGRVTNPDGTPAFDTEVAIGGVTTRTDRKGKYEFAEVNLGTFTVTFSPAAGPGATGQIDNVRITDGGKDKLDFTLPRPV